MRLDTSEGTRPAVSQAATAGLLEELQSLTVAVNRHPERARTILLDRFEHYRRDSPDRAQMAILLLTIVQARHEVETPILIKAANLNLGTQVGTINAILNDASQTGPAAGEVANAIKLVLGAVESSTDLDITAKQNATDALQTVAESVQKPGSIRKGTVAAVLAGIPSFLAGAEKVSDLWVTWEPTIRSFLGI